MQHTEAPAFGKIRNFFWPIHSFELKKLIPMFVLFFLISFVYNLLRCMKIALIVTAQYSGAEVIPFLKMGAVLPGALLLTYIFTKLANRFEREQVFYTILSGFLLYFSLFLFVLYPNNEFLRLDSLADFLQKHVFVNKGFKGLIAIIRHWNLTLFYVLAEMWSTVVLSILFWGFANEVTKLHEAKRFYAIFGLGANFAAFFSALFAHFVKAIPYNAALPFDVRNQWVFYQLFFVLVVGMIIIALFYWLNRSVFHMEDVQTLQIPKKSKKISLQECFKYLRESKYLSYIVILIISYNAVFNLADVMWNYKVKQIYVNSVDYNGYINKITSLTSIISIIFAFFISGNVIRYYGWIIAALVTPLIWLLTSIGFFTGLIFDGTFITDFLAIFISNPTNLVLFLGATQMCFGRACKYTVFDATKEIAFIPLTKEEKRKGKAVVDGIASRFGKSGGSLIYILLFMMCGDIVNTVPYVALIVVIIIGFWIYAVFHLGKMVNESIDKEVVEKDLAVAEAAV